MDGIDYAEQLITQLEHRGRHKVLRRLDIATGLTGLEGDINDTSVGLAIDCETTGLDPDKHTIIELAMRRFRYDRQGRILKIDRPWSWYQDPGEALSADIVRLTGITDQDLVGQQINDDDAVTLLRSADLVVAHSAAFDRKFVERRLPHAAGLAWACSCTEIDWAGAGFDGRALGWLVAQSGYFFTGHRAGADVDAVIALLRHLMPDGRTVLAELVANSVLPSTRIEAVGADFEVKDELRTRGYRWNATEKVWWRDVSAKDLTAEQFWLASNVYGPDRNARAMGPRMTEITARERYA